MSNKVEDFMSRLSSMTPKAKDASTSNRSLEKIYLNYPGNFGRYQILPMDNTVTDFPFVQLFGTREINIPRKNVGSDGQESVYNAWVKILPKSAYIMKDSTGRVVSSLTAADEELLGQAYSIFDMLHDELDVRNNRDAAITGLLRKRNYTLFQGKCINKWKDGDMRTPERQNFVGLFVCTAKAFTSVVEASIQEKSALEGGDMGWTRLIYNRQQTGREGFLMFGITPNKTTAGYSVTALHEIGRGEMLKSFPISDEEMELMGDPVQSFLGWQAAKSVEGENPNQRRLFNAPLIQEAIQYLSQQLAAVRMAKQSGVVDMATAIQQTSSQALAGQAPTTTQGQPTNDPMLSQMAASAGQSFSGSQGVVNPGAVSASNNAPFQTPPVAHVDPISGGFVGQQEAVTAAPEAPYTPQFGPAFGGFNGGNTPFPANN